MPQTQSTECFAQTPRVYGEDLDTSEATSIHPPRTDGGHFGPSSYQAEGAEGLFEQWYDEFFDPKLFESKPSKFPEPGTMTPYDYVVFWGYEPLTFRAFSGRQDLDESAIWDCILDEIDERLVPTAQEAYTNLNKVLNAMEKQSLPISTPPLNQFESLTTT
ncbi:hypothetical protein DXG01_017021 [Tephrocybe rancida]|nr:hypothetical protein DXG01_017021 [Tephrocybe rancida]